MDYQLPEGWVNVHSSPILDCNSNTQPVNSVGQPQLDEGEMVIEDGQVKSRQYFIVQCPDSKVKAIVPGVKNNQDYVGKPKRTRQEALQDAFNVLNSVLPTDYLGAASKRTPDKVHTLN